MRKETLEEHNIDKRDIRTLTVLIDAKQEYIRELLKKRRAARNRVQIRESRV